MPTRIGKDNNPWLSYSRTNNLLKILSLPYGVGFPLPVSILCSLHVWCRFPFHDAFLRCKRNTSRPGRMQGFAHLWASCELTGYPLSTLTFLLFIPGGRTLGIGRVIFGSINPDREPACLIRSRNSDRFICQESSILMTRCIIRRILLFNAVSNIIQ